MADTTIKRIDKQLQKYYESVQAEYKPNKDGFGLFAEFCQENELHDDDINGELEQVPTDSILVEFDAHFPLCPPPKDKDARAEQIFSIIKMCFEGGVTNISYPQFNKQLYDDITPNDVQRVKDLYETQCPAIYNAGMKNDDDFCRVATIGYRHKFDYLQHLIDAYYRDRLKDTSNELTVGKWVKSHKHFIELEKLSQNEYDIAKSAVAAFSNRACPTLMFTNTVEINGSLKATVQNIVAMIEFVGNMTKKGKGVEVACPFQVDLCLAFGEPQNKEHMESFDVNESDDDDDDDDDDDVSDKKKGAFVDVIGDIQQKLDANKLQHVFKKQDEFKETTARLIHDMFKEFKMNKDPKDNKNYPHESRWITFVDSRRNKKGDIFMYDAPKNCRNIPSNAVAEWFISAAKQCLIPAANGDEKGNDSDDVIKTTSDCGGALLTLSVIAREEDIIKAYLYWNGQMIRFEPQDIRTVLPKIFNMKWNNGVPLDENEMSLNEEFLEEIDQSNAKYVDILIEKMKRVLTDKPFQAFVQKYK